MKRIAALPLLLCALAASAADPVRLSCTRESDTFAGYVLYNPEIKVASIDGTNWTVNDNGSGILQAGALNTPGPYIRMNRFNGAVAARWRPTTPAGSLDLAAICEVVARKF